MLFYFSRLEVVIFELYWTRTLTTHGLSTQRLLQYCNVIDGQLDSEILFVQPELSRAYGPSIPL